MNAQIDPCSGYYRVLIGGAASNTWSETATWLVLMRLIITHQPIALTTLQGATAIFTVVAAPDYVLNPLIAARSNVRKAWRASDFTAA